MSTSSEYVKRAEECERLAGACIAEANRQILLYAAVRWRWMAEEEGRSPAPSDSTTQGNDRLEDADGAG
jgi:hypothetical protein